MLPAHVFPLCFQLTVDKVYASSIQKLFLAARIKLVTPALSYCLTTTCYVLHRVKVTSNMENKRDNNLKNAALTGACVPE